MSSPAEPLLSFHSLYDSPLVSVRDYRCRACRSGPEAEEQSGRNEIVLMRRGVFCKHFGRRSVTADVNQAVFFSKGSTYRISHPADCGDRGTVLTASPDVLQDLIRDFDPSIDECSDRPFPLVTVACDPAVFWRHHALVRRLEAAGSRPVDPLWVDEAALRLISGVLSAVYRQLGRPRPRRRRGTEADHAERAEAVKTFLGSRLGQRVTLDALARNAHASPYHLARVFQRQAGVPIHRYLTRLRLRASLERLAEGADDLTAVALELGFSSHSHFTDTFRREFGRTPSEVRREFVRRPPRQVSKDLEV